MTDNVAVLDGYTEEYEGHAKTGPGQYFLLVKPGTDLTAAFRAWDMEQQEYVQVAGYMWDFTKKGT